MPPVGELKSQTLESGETLIMDESGQSWLWPAPLKGPHLLDLIDPRLDLSKPIYEQVQRLANEDQSLEPARAGSATAA